MQLFLFSSFLCKPTCLFQLEQTVYSHFSWNKWIFWSLVFQEFFNLFTVMKTETTSKTTKLEHSPLFWNLNFDKKTLANRSVKLSTAQSWYFLRWKKNVFLIKIEKNTFYFLCRSNLQLFVLYCKNWTRMAFFKRGIYEKWVLTTSRVYSTSDIFSYLM